jgi:hypothetical protein
MTPPRKATRLLTHAAALGSGVLLAALAPGLVTTLGLTPAVAANSASPEPFSASSPQKTSREAAAAGMSRSAEFRAAWNQLKRRPLERNARDASESKLLAQWVEIDPVAAMKTVTEERDGWTMSGAFRDYFAQHPLDAWKVFASGRIGPNISGLEQAWAKVAAKKDPKLVTSLLGEMPPGLQRSAMGDIFMAGDYDAMRQNILEAIHAVSDPVRSAALATAAYKMMDSTEPTEVLRSQWSALPAGSPDRTAAMAAWASTLRGKDAAGISSEFAILPESERAGAAKALLASIGQDVPALLPALNQVIASGQWDYLDQSALGKTSGTRRPQELAEWAMNLPDRPEALGLFQEMTGAYVRGDPDAARAMLEALPEGDWRRENGMAQIYGKDLWSDNNVDRFNARIATLTDPGAIRSAESARYRYEIAMGKKVTR